ncbi:MULTISPECIES: amino acid adenylation domain-containing protein [Kitasatospora]|uniref:Amino acid adenylation domain-containing protein n=1 Tax=Kitasatospora cathayae TaxID=3004092 RepID=A0ABY7QCU5_9ACTN|nr:amino acid adenylation domain-containing protein [Kitasatospora sp. HUAS 3-15]WBP90584.1 amino acid adenylation domain-containing protein [Kitasatospora sp. HUAS 3-15]
MTVDEERAATLHGLVARQARRAPQAVAVRCGEAELTYGELDARADRLAAVLARRGLAPGGRAAVALGRGTEVYVALLAVLKAGAAFVPVEPTAPDALLRHVLADAAPDLVLTEQRYRARLTDAAASEPVCVDEPAAPDGEFEHPEVEPGDLACVFYTSGSTGLPTGAMVEHRNLLAAYAGWREVYGLTAEDRILQTASLEFDVFTADWVRALCTGATLVVAPFNLTLDRTADLAALPALVAEERITVMELNVRTARRLTALLEAGGTGLPGVRLLTVGAEKWYLDEQLALQRLLGGSTRVLNVYGLAEATVDSTYFEVRGAAAAEGAERVSLVGRPFPGTRVYVLGPNATPVAPGRVGEIAVAGGGLTRGYLNRPADTARRFVRADFDPDGRVLLTGDLGLLRADGVLEFVGRAATVVGPLGAERATTVTTRVKAAARAEGVLRAHPAVREAAVVEVERTPGQRVLVGYAVPARGTPEGTDGWSLTQYLLAELNGYSAPAAVIPVAELPRTRAGKLDRAALPLPAPPRHTGPRSAKGGGSRKGGGKAGGGRPGMLSEGEAMGCFAASIVLGGAFFAWMFTDAFFASSTDVSAVPNAYQFGFELLYLCENLAFGAGVAFLVLGLPAVLRQGRSLRLSLLTWISVFWLLASWWPQDNLYRLTESTDWSRETIMVFVFNIPLMLAAVVVVVFLLSKPKAKK